MNYGHKENLLLTILGPLAMSAIFLSYSNKSKAYRVYNLSSKVIYESSNVVINDSRYD